MDGGDTSWKKEWVSDTNEIEWWMVHGTNREQNHSIMGQKARKVLAIEKLRYDRKLFTSEAEGTREER